MTMIEPSAIKALKRVVGKANVLTAPEDLLCYSYDSTFAEHLPDAVVQPKTTEEVADVLRIAHGDGIPVVPRGMASGLAAASVPFSGGIALSLTRMNRILEIDEANMTATAEAGVITAHLQDAVEARGLFYPPDPSSIRQSTIGGNVACNAGGPRCLKYGITGDYVLGLKTVLADGRVLQTGGKAIKNVTGYNLTQLFVGSEGTLGVITEVLVKLISRPEHVRTALAVYEDLDDASRSVNAILSAGIVPCTLEMMDDTTIETIEEYMRLGLPVGAAALLILESDGEDQDTVDREVEAMAAIARRHGASDVRVADSESARDELWRGRRSVGPSLARRAPNKLGEDISVPRSQIPEAVRRIKQIGHKYDLPIVVFGHAGDGNLHPNILFDKRDDEQWQRVEQAVGAIFEVAVELGGTLSGEHGVGVLKQPYLEHALGPVSIEMQRRIKDAWDPNHILNPGKVFPARDGH
jgi:glycolate oxidase